MLFLPLIFRATVVVAVSCRKSQLERVVKKRYKEAVGPCVPRVADPDFFFKGSDSDPV